MSETLKPAPYVRGERRPVKARHRKHYGPKRPDPREIQLALKLMGGTTDKDKGEPFDDEIPF